MKLNSGMSSLHWMWKLPLCKGHFKGENQWKVPNSTGLPYSHLLTYTLGVWSASSQFSIWGIGSRWLWPINYSPVWESFVLRFFSNKCSFKPYHLMYNMPWQAVTSLTWRALGTGLMKLWLAHVTGSSPLLSLSAWWDPLDDDCMKPPGVCCLLWCDSFPPGSTCPPTLDCLRYFYWRFGSSAQLCRPPCSWHQENPKPVPSHW